MNDLNINERQFKSPNTIQVEPKFDQVIIPKWLELKNLEKSSQLCPIAKRASAPAALPWSSILAIPTHYRTGVYNINEHGLQKCTTLAVDDSAEYTYRCATEDMRVFGAIGSGASSVVQRAIRISTYWILALKKINIFEKILDDPSPAPSKHKLSSEFCSFIEACLQKDADDRICHRFQSGRW